MKQVYAANIGQIEPITETRAPEGDKNEHFVASLEAYISDIIGTITILAGLFFIVYSFSAAFQWVTAGGDSGKITKARDHLVWGTLGLVLIVATYSILGLIGSLVGFSILDIGATINKITPKP